MVSYEWLIDSHVTENACNLYLRKIQDWPVPLVKTYLLLLCWQGFDGDVIIF